MSNKMAVEMHCSLKQCKFPSGGITYDQDRVEVKTFVPNDKNAAGINFQAHWGERGDAIFHNECWNNLLKCRDQLSQIELDMIREARNTAEFHHGSATMKTKALKIADMIKNSKFCIAFTGAGVSTSAGIGDFRGKSGKWTENDRTKEYGSGAKADKEKRFSYADLRPTYTHEALAKLMEMGYIKHLISQNCDGLHSLSGVPIDRLWELHGNVFHERCEDCGARYERPRAVHGGPRVGQSALKACPTCHCYHQTGRRCERPGCHGYLMDTVINFGDQLEPRVIDGAQEVACKNDMVLCLGTTLKVSPANSLVEAGNPIRLVICNRQPTPCDFMCRNIGPNKKTLGSRVFGDCDPLMSEIMGHILGEEGRETWESVRKDRMKAYSQKRGS